MAWRMSWRRVWVWWLTVSFALALLLSFTDPEVTQGLGLLPAFALWFAHVSVGLLLAVLCVRGLAKVRALARLPALVQRLLGGLIGSVLFAPLAFGIESLWPPEGEEIVDGFLDEWERAGGALAVVAEWLRLALQYLSSWALLNLPPLLASQRPELNHPQDPPPQRRAAFDPGGAGRASRDIPGRSGAGSRVASDRDSAGSEPYAGLAKGAGRPTATPADPAAGGRGSSDRCVVDAAARSHTAGDRAPARRGAVRSALPSRAFDPRHRDRSRLDRGTRVGAR